MSGAVQQDPAVPESDLLKAIGDLEEAANLQKGETEPVPRGYMDSTESARGGSATVLDGGPGSRHDLKPGGHEDKEHFDMGAATGPRAEMGKSHGDKGKKKDGDDDDDGDKKDAKKSMRKSLGERPTIKKAVEVSQFLEELVDTTVDSVDGLRKAVYENQDIQQSFNGRLAKAVVAIGNTVVDLQNTINGLSNEPATMRKSVLSADELSARDFEGQGADHHGNAQAAEIGKSDVLDFLVDKVEKGEIPPETVTEFELTNVLPPNIAADVRTHFGS